jgi:AcrR family transcriptional regulator
MVYDCFVLKLADQHPILRRDVRRNRDAVVAAALHVLCDRPTASMQEIADASLLGRTTLYRHFASRDDLIAALIERALQESRVLSERAAAQEGPVLVVLETLCRETVELGDRYRFLAACAPGMIRAREKTALLAYVRRAQRNGELRSDLPATWILESLRGLAIGALGAISDGQLNVSRAADLVAATFVASVAPVPRASQAARRAGH